MTAEALPAWNVCTQICAEHWDGCTHVSPRYHTRSSDSLVNQMLACGEPERIGYIEYRCRHGGEGTPQVAMSCQSSLCLRCATVYVDHGGSQVSRRLHAGILYRPIVLTVPERLRKTLYQQSKAVVSPFMRCGVRGWDDVFSRVRGKPLQGGYIMVIQTHGRNGQYHPPLHGIATSGGWEPQGKQWIHLDSVPYPLWRKKWPWPLLTRRRQPGKSKEIHRLVEACSTRYREGFVTNVPKGEVPARSQSWATYLAQDVVRPPISLRRIDRYDGHSVTYHYRSQKSERVERETVDVETFIGRTVQLCG